MSGHPLRAELEGRHFGMNPFVTLSSLSRKRLILGISLALIARGAAFAQTSEVPRPVVDLKPGTVTFKIRIESDGPAVNMESTRTTRAVNDTWVLSERTTTGSNVQTDELTVEKKTLRLRRRVFHENDAVADLK